MMIVSVPQEVSGGTVVVPGGEAEVVIVVVASVQTGGGIVGVVVVVVVHDVVVDVQCLDDQPWPPPEAPSWYCWRPCARALRLPRRNSFWAVEVLIL